MTLAYKYGDGLYLNITNRCCCACEFCIRLDHDSVGGSDSLWLEREPTAAEVLEAVAKFDPAEYNEFVFCGYGEPTERLELMLEVCRGLRKTYPGTPIRLNTNGLADLINHRETAPLLAGLVDTVSVSLNAPDARRYQEIVHSAFGEESFSAMLSYAKACTDYVPKVKFSVVDIITPEEIGQCRLLTQQLEIPLRVRQKS